MTPVSICTIMKNEEKHIGNFLNAIDAHFRGYPYEIVLVDTGSEDRSVEIARKFAQTQLSNDNLRLEHFDWINDFSAAKNHAISMAKNDWILVLDADEYVVKFDRRSIDLMEEGHKDAIGVIDILNHTENGISKEKVSRLFHRDYYHFEGIIHEQLCPVSLPADTAAPGTPVTGQISEIPHVAVPITIDHYGYIGTPEEMQAKAERNNALLFQMLEKSPDDPYLYYQLGQSFSAIKDYENAYHYYGEGLAFDVDPRLDYIQQMVVGYGYAMLETRRYAEALNYEGIYEEFKESADFLCLMGLIYLRNGRINEAYAEFQNATLPGKSCEVSGSDSYLSYYNMAIIDEAMGNTERAVELYKKCGDFAPALSRLQLL